MRILNERHCKYRNMLRNDEASEVIKDIELIRKINGRLCFGDIKMLEEAKQYLNKGVSKNERLWKR